MTYAVRVVRVALDRHAERLDVMARDLAEDERDVAPPTARARAAARAVLGSMLGLDPTTLQITRECTRCGDPSHGKPRLHDEPLTFNVSHSGAVMLVAAGAPGRLLGVDVEAVRRRSSNLDQLAARTLGESELAAWRALSENERLAGFLSMWTVKEAVLKATGQGIATRLRDVDVAPAGWTVQSLNVGAGYVASLAVDASPVSVSFEEWRN